MRTVVDKESIAILLIDGKAVPALRVDRRDGVYNGDIRPNPHHVMNVMCRNLTVRHEDHWYVVFTNTVEWDDAHMLAFDTFQEAEAFWRAYVIVQAQAAQDAPAYDLVELHRVNGILFSGVYTPYQESWNLYDVMSNRRGVDDCCVCGKRITGLHYYSEMDESAHIDCVKIHGEA